ncbi:LPS export ABC transporter periplasmic protein LptC [uncultured Rikenella sp.]|uniref:LPS export ABC transporter periplasmic protein LptC n=1 Tax=uncultured Rikenella sp. TaxID=368003 RepID=UPI00260CAFE8|nr:LPS export ABC transporter periplasmic protein LptC [uncultured Rikenella sp.]
MKSLRQIISPQTVLAATLAAGTLFLSSCGKKEPKPTIEDPETTPTQVSHNHRMINSVDGYRQYRMETPLLERYELATEPFMEFREGIKIETFDSLLRVESDLVADYARLNEVTDLWEARGNVVAHNYTGERGGRTLYTERLYWDQKKKKIYSDTTAKVIDGGSVHVGSNFEADESFETWSFHNTSGKIEVDAAALRDTAGTAEPAPAAGQVPTAMAPL